MAEGTTVMAGGWAGPVLRWVLALAALYLVASAGAWLVAPQMLFPAPPPGYGDLPGGIDLPGPGGGKLAAVLLPREGAARLLIHFHGNGEDLAGCHDRLRWLRGMGFAVLAVDYPGYGRSSGSPSVAGLRAAAEAAWAHATGPLGWSPNQIVLHGVSLGGAAAAHLAARHDPATLVLDRAFRSAYAVVLPWPPLLGEPLPVERWVRQARCPVLVIHGLSDEIVPFSHGRALHAAAARPLPPLWVEGAGHNDLEFVAGGPYAAALRRLLPGS